MLDTNKLESKMAKSDGAKVVKNSGRGDNKGDAKTDSELIDYKFTDSKSFSLNVVAFMKHEKDSYKAGREPVVVAVFQQYKNKRIAMVDYEWYLELAEKAAQYDQLCK